MKFLTPGYDFKAEFGASRIVLGAMAVLRIQDGMLLKAPGFDLCDVLRARGRTPVPLDRR